MITQHIGAKRTPLPPSGLTAAAVALPILGMLWIALTWAWWPAGADLPRRDDAQISMVLAPTASSGKPATRIAAVGWERPARDWVFPFDRPDAPEENGNQALAVNTTDGSVTYSVEFALVWAEDGAPVETRNEAYAFASCTGCTAVAVGFQVVLIVEQADVIAPENHSAAVNYNCLECLSHALASQLVLIVDGPLSTDGMERLSALWDEIDEYGSNLENAPLSEIESRLEAYKEQIIAIVQADKRPTPDGAATSTQTAIPDPTTGSTAQPSVTPV
jgi:putative peptide zinc metalloprotease protein